MKFLGLCLAFATFSFWAWAFWGLFFVFALALLWYSLHISINQKFWVFYGKVLIILILLNFSSSFWILNASILEAFVYFWGYSVYMSFSAIITYIWNRKVRRHWVAVFITTWLAFEVLNNTWVLGWGGLTLGYVMGNQHYLVQWYSIFGVYSGSLWLLLLGYFLHQIIFVYSSTNVLSRPKLIRLFLFFCLPVLISLFVFFVKPLNQAEPIKVTTYAPIDFRANYFEKTRNLYQFSKEHKLGTFVLCPELFFNSTTLRPNQGGQQLFFFDRIVAENDSICIVFGAEIAASNRLFNSLVFYSADDFLIKTKKRNVPGREYIPPFLRPYFGDSYYYGSSIDHQRQIIEEYKIFPLLCFESIFVNYTPKNLGEASIIFLATSVEFLGNCNFGKRKYLNIVRLRAIESNRNLIKCSTNGYSAVINEKGTISALIDKEIETVTAYRINKPSILTRLLGLM